MILRETRHIFVSNDFIIGPQKHLKYLGKRKLRSFTPRDFKQWHCHMKNFTRSQRSALALTFIFTANVAEK